MRILGLDPGLRHTGWGIIESQGSALRLIACGRISPDPKADMADRLHTLHAGILHVIEEWAPTSAAVEETFVNMNPASTLKLGAARGVVMMSPAAAGLSVGEYSANKVKKSVVGVGHADKNQVVDMVKRLLPGSKIESEDAADALAVAICHAHHTQISQRWEAAV